MLISSISSFWLLLDRRGLERLKILSFCSCRRCSSQKGSAIWSVDHRRRQNSAQNRTFDGADDRLGHAAVFLEAFFDAAMDGDLVQLAAVAQSQEFVVFG